MLTMKKKKNFVTITTFLLSDLNRLQFAEFPIECFVNSSCNAR